MNSKQLIFIAIACTSVAALATSDTPTEAIAFQQYQTDQLMAAFATLPPGEAISQAQLSLIPVRALLINLQTVNESDKEAPLKSLRRELLSLIQLANKQLPAKDNQASPRTDEDEKVHTSRIFSAPRYSEIQTPRIPQACSKFERKCPFTKRSIEAEIKKDVLTVRVFVPLEDSSNPPAHPEVSLEPEPEDYVEPFTIELPKGFDKKYQLADIDMHQRDCFSILLKETDSVAIKCLTFRTNQHHPVKRYFFTHEGYMELPVNPFEVKKDKKVSWVCQLLDNLIMSRLMTTH